MTTTKQLLDCDGTALVVGCRVTVPARVAADKGETRGYVIKFGLWGDVLVSDVPPERFAWEWGSFGWASWLRPADLQVIVDPSRTTPTVDRIDFQRLVEWSRDPSRKPAEAAFTAGVTRDAASAVESSGLLDRVAAAVAPTGEPGQPFTLNDLLVWPFSRVLAECHARHVDLPQTHTPPMANVHRVIERFATDYVATVPPPSDPTPAGGETYGQQMADGLIIFKTGVGLTVSLPLPSGGSVDLVSDSTLATAPSEGMAALLDKAHADGRAAQREDYAAAARTPSGDVPNAAVDPADDIGMRYAGLAVAADGGLGHAAVWEPTGETRFRVEKVFGSSVPGETDCERVAGVVAAIVNAAVSEATADLSQKLAAAERLAGEKSAKAVATERASTAKLRDAMRRRQPSEKPPAGVTVLMLGEYARMEGGRYWPAGDGRDQRWEWRNGETARDVRWWMPMPGCSEEICYAAAAQTAQEVASG